MRVPAYLPDTIDITEALNIIYHPFRGLERGVQAPAAVPDGEAILKGTLYCQIGDAPNQAEVTHTKSSNAQIFCQACLHPSSTIAESDKVRTKYTLHLYGCGYEHDTLYKVSDVYIKCPR